MGIPVLIRCECGVIANVRQFPLYCCCGKVHQRQPAGLGDYVAAGLHAIGITKARYVRVKRWLGLAPACGCIRRQARLNTIGKFIKLLAMPWKPRV